MVEQLADGHRRVLECCSLGLDDCPHGARREVDQVEHEHVWCLRLDVVGLERLGGKVLQILGDDDPGAGTDCRCENVPIIGVGQHEPIDEALVSGREAIGDGIAHHLPRALELSRSEVGPIGEDGADHLIEDLVGPAGAEQAGLCEPDQEVPDARG